MNKEIQKAVRMKDKETARQHMMKVQKKTLQTWCNRYRTKRSNQPNS